MSLPTVVFPLGDMERTAVQEGSAVGVNTTLADVLRLADDLGIPPEHLNVRGEIAAAGLSDDECERSEGTGDRFGRAYGEKTPCPDCGGSVVDASSEER